ncbi:hypothetical protein E1176_02765 [Fulvivirga sp. RKSG066]|uniref:hypothetical protein n=1 Tax=Fulvivirga aurantia TaxID=2529383 RepID=UPI0012BC2408|nr:hypothetical protein [Fulvivirga aurantia]MTI19933.1 hypothetical protein [Fulvivirga aurantia]
MRQYNFEKRDHYIFAKVTGQRNNLLDIIKGSQKIHDAAQTIKCPYFLLDYTDVKFNVSRIEAFNIIRYFEKSLPFLKKVSMSFAVNQMNYDIIKYWEELCHERGFNNAVFLNVEEARQWLLTVINQQGKQ